MPLNFFYAALIRRALPNAKIICVRRGALDACLGSYRQLFATSFAYYNYSYDLLDTGRYYVAFDALSRRWRQSLGEGYTEVRYEDVVEHTEREARRLLEFCGLRWDPACLAFQNNAAPVADSLFDLLEIQPETLSELLDGGVSSLTTSRGKTSLTRRSR